MTGQQTTEPERVIATDPRTGDAIEPGVDASTVADVDRLCAAAASAAPALRAAAGNDTAKLLDRIADLLDEHAAEIIATADREAALGTARLTGEMGRTTGQLRMFAGIAASGAWREPVTDEPLPDREPAPRPALARVNVPIGPVAVFAASNFPLAFSVAGGDTASALAVGCPVVVKAHEAHPATSELVGDLISRAVADSGLPDGTFGLVQAAHHEVGAALVQHPAIAAVAFTGSERGGRALVELGAARAVPIPVFAEMGSTNPVFVLPAAVGNATLPTGLAGSITLGSGQFCTKPGVIVGVGGDEWDAFADALSAEIAGIDAVPMLTPRIVDAYADGASARSEIDEVGALVERDGAPATAPTLMRCTSDAYAAHPSLRNELFGPTALLVDVDTADALVAFATRLDGQLTATIHADLDDAADRALAGELAAALAEVAGRVILNGFPTGVEVVASMQHGGPFPASSDSRFTSVGGSAWRRFVRPVCLQGFPPDVLPAHLR